MGNYVVVLGSSITDLVARAPRLPVPGEAVIGDDFATFLGGKGFNQAVAAARAGAGVHFIGRVGQDSFGDAFAEALAAEGIAGKHLTRDADTGTGTACVMIGTDIGQNAIIVLPRANLALTPAMIEDAMHSILTQPELADSPGVFMAQCEMRMETIAAGLRAAREAGLITLFNMAPIPREPLPAEFFALTDILVVNEAEAATLTGLRVDTPVTAMAAATQLLDRGCQHIIITLGAQGSVWSQRTAGRLKPAHYTLRGFPVTPVDPTAAGDAFCGTLAASLADDIPMREALRRANAAGAISVTRMGALPSLPTRAEVEAMLTTAHPGETN